MAKPADTVRQLAEAINRGDLEAAVGLYDAKGVLVVQPGQLARGPGEIRAALAGFIGLKPTLRTEAEHVVEAGDIALYVSRWTLKGVDPTGKPVAMGGESSDILRRQSDGRWLIAIDNPWGAKILG